MTYYWTNMLKWPQGLFVAFAKSKTYSGYIGKEQIVEILNGQTFRW